jgi:hypothetical protein
MLLLGNNISASEARDTFGFVNRIVSVDASASAEEGNAAVLDVAFALAAQINANSPDAVACTKEALLAARDVGLGADGVNHSVIEQYCNERNRALYVGENIKEGLKAFAEVSGHARDARCSQMDSPTDSRPPPLSRFATAQNRNARRSGRIHPCSAGRASYSLAVRLAAGGREEQRGKSHARGNDHSVRSTEGRVVGHGGS